MFVRTENFRQFTRSYPVTSLFLAVIIILFIFMKLPVIGRMVYGFGVGQNMAIAHGEYWRLLTSIFLHRDVMHFLFNGFALFIFAPALERLLGSFKFIILYLAAGLAGNIGTFLLGHDTIPYLGASGALYGLLGLYLFMVLFRKDLIDPGSAQIVKVILIIGLIYTIIVPRINLYAHLFGFLGGLAFGPIYLKERFNRWH